MANGEQWPSLIQWLMGIGVVIGGIIVSIFGARSHKEVPDDEDHLRLAAAERLVEEEKILRRTEKLIQDNMQLLRNELEEMKERRSRQWSDFDQRLRQLERDYDRSIGSRNPRTPRGS